MSGLVVTIPLAILISLGAFLAFFWALRSGQYEDRDGASQRILNGDDSPSPPAR